MSSLIGARRGAGFVSAAVPAVHAVAATAASTSRPELVALDQKRRELVGAACHALACAAQRLLGETVTGAAAALASRSPGEPLALAAQLEAQARALLLRSDLPPSHVNQIVNILRCGADLRCVARGIDEAALLWRLIGDGAFGDKGLVHGRWLCTHLHALHTAAVVLARTVAEASDRGDEQTAVCAAAAYREIEAAREKVESELRVGGLVSPGLRRALRALVHSTVVAAENLARMTARGTLPL